MGFTLKDRSEKALIGVHPDLARVVRHAAKHSMLGFSFIVTEGLRTHERQVQLFKVGATRTMNSRHLTGHATDLAAMINDQVHWDWPLYRKMAVQMKASARELGVPLEWGGDWKSFADGPHYQLPFMSYPATPLPRTVKT